MEVGYRQGPYGVFTSSLEDPTGYTSYESTSTVRLLEPAIAADTYMLPAETFHGRRKGSKRWFGLRDRLRPGRSSGWSLPQIFGGLAVADGCLSSPDLPGA